MSGQALAVCLMAAGSIAALVAAAGPIDRSVTLAAFYSLAVAMIGVGVTLRRKARHTPLRPNACQPEVPDPLRLLQPVADAIESAWEDLTEQPFTARHGDALDETTETPIREFIQRRQALRDHLGVERFADLMIRFAAVERLVNRARSASADGAAEEARESLSRARQAMVFCLACPGVIDSSPSNTR